MLGLEVVCLVVFGDAGVDVAALLLCRWRCWLSLGRSWLCAPVQVAGVLVRETGLDLVPSDLTGDCVVMAAQQPHMARGGEGDKYRES